MQFAVLDAGAVSSKEVLFAAAAVDKQMREHLAPAYGIEPYPVVHYTDVKQLPLGSYYLLVVVDQVPEGELGDHDMLRTGRVLYRNNPDWVQVLSHEVIEMRLDIGCDIWLPHPARSGYWLAYEAGDPCQAGKYEIIAEIMGESQVLQVSNFVLPAYWQPGARGAYDWMGTIKGPGEIAPGGYQIVRGPDGIRSFVPDQAMDVATMAAKMTTDSRAFRVMTTPQRAAKPAV